MPSSARQSAWALQQMRFLIVRGPIWIGEKRVGKAVAMAGTPWKHHSAALRPAVPVISQQPSRLRRGPRLLEERLAVAGHGQRDCDMECGRRRADGAFGRHFKDTILALEHVAMSADDAGLGGVLG